VTVPAIGPRQRTESALSASLIECLLEERYRSRPHPVQGRDLTQVSSAQVSQRMNPRRGQGARGWRADARKFS